MCLCPGKKAGTKAARKMHSVCTVHKFAKIAKQNRLVFSGTILPEWLPDGRPALVKFCFTLNFIN